MIDPRTGLPAAHVRSSPVVAAKATDADALATACSILSIEESMALIESLPDAACLLLDEHELAGTGITLNHADWFGAISSA